MIAKIITRTGTEYIVNAQDGWYRRNQGKPQEMTWMTSGTMGVNLRLLKPQENEEIKLPEVGEHLYIIGKTPWDWVLSTKIVSVERLD